jgi:hypothetical protein
MESLRLSRGMRSSPLNVSRAFGYMIYNPPIVDGLMSEPLCLNTSSK